MDFYTEKTTDFSDGPEAKMSEEYEEIVKKIPRKGAKKPAKGVPSDSLLMQVRKVIKTIMKEDDPSVDVDVNTLTASHPHFSSGSVVLDYLIGGTPNQVGVAPCPGWPKGKISNIFGHESSGKTTIALEAAAVVCAAGGVVCFIDWENAISLDYAKALGVPVDDQDRFYLVQPNTLEAGLSVMFACARAGVDLIILDSVGAGVPKQFRDQGLDEKGLVGRPGLVAQIWSKVLPELAAEIHESGTHVMGISQIRKKLNMTGYGGDDSTHQGGEAWKFFSSIRMSFKRIQSIKSKEYDAITHKTEERVTSSVIKARIVKTKVSASQQREAEFHITFGEGIDNVRDMMKIGMAHGVIGKAGAWYSFERTRGDSVKSCGVPALKQDLLRTPGAYEELTEKILQVMRGAGDSFLAVADEEDSVGDSGFVSE